jgi:MSHA biogenesis protein MshL
MRFINLWWVAGSCAWLTACGTQPIQPSNKHISAPLPAASNIPQPIKRIPVLTPPQAAPRVETMSVVVNNQPVQSLLFELARDAKINLDVHPGIEGNVTLNAINQTLPQILNRIAKQVEMRYELEHGNLIVMPDSPFLKHYKIDYLNMSRDADSTVSNSGGVGSGGTTGGSGNNSSLIIKNASKNHFWDTLTKNISDLLHETDRLLPAGSSETTTEQKNSNSTTGTGVQPVASKKSTAPKSGLENSPNPTTIEGEGVTVTRTNTFREAAAVIANPESGIITVRATGKQHEKIQEFVDQVMGSARRQVLIEATVVEVRLSDAYKQGINWSQLRLGTRGLALAQAGTPLTALTAPAGTLIMDYANPTSKLGNLSAQVSLLESFGTVKVVSSPKLSVMNNQTAMLRVVDNLVYFSIKADTTANQNTTTTTFTTTANTVPIGFTMSITPQINDSDAVQLSLRPSITRLLGYVSDPSPTLAAAGVISRIPQTQTREMESLITINNNQIAVMGGLMQDESNQATTGIPGLDRLPGIGGLFQGRDDSTQKTELVIFLRPVVIKNASIDGDFSAYREDLPNADFFKPDTRAGQDARP